MRFQLLGKYKITGINRNFFKELFYPYRGRINRNDYFTLTVMHIFVFQEFLEYINNFPIIYTLLSLVNLILAYIVYGLAIRRLHDIGLSGFWAIPFYFVILFPSFFKVAIDHFYDYVLKTMDLFSISNSVLLYAMITVIAFFYGYMFFLWMWPGMKTENKYGKPYEYSTIFTFKERGI